MRAPADRAQSPLPRHRLRWILLAIAASAGLAIAGAHGIGDRSLHYLFKPPITTLAPLGRADRDAGVRIGIGKQV